MKNMLTVSELAKKWGISTVRVRYYITEGRIKTQRIGRNYVIAANHADPRKPIGHPKKNRNG